MASSHKNSMFVGGAPSEPVLVINQTLLNTYIYRLFVRDNPLNVSIEVWKKKNRNLFLITT